MLIPRKHLYHSQFKQLYDFSRNFDRYPKAIAFLIVSLNYKVRFTPDPGEVLWQVI